MIGLLEMMNKNNQRIETFSHSKEGYNPYLIGPRWQVAQLNYEHACAPSALNKLDVHHKTDEAFLLMEGEAVLIAADVNEKGVDFELSKMKPNVLYNIPKGCWHNIALWEDAKVLIVEDANTHLPLPQGDYEFHYLIAEEQKKLVKGIDQMIEN